MSENQQDFDVVDQWNADEPRSVKTLSGGETFLASLALALTMAESLPGLAPGQHVALDSIFIDEGLDLWTRRRWSGLPRPSTRYGRTIAWSASSRT